MNIKRLNNNHRLALLLLVMYGVSRFFIWVNGPREFTEIIYSYMPYAHLWASGTKPYLEQWYEYPPLTIPLFYLPHLIDMKTLNLPIHLNYRDSYRGILLLTDFMMVGLIYLTGKKMKWSQGRRLEVGIFYCLATLKANHFIYDSMDYTFALGLLLTVVSGIIWTKRGEWWGWFGYYVAVGLKLVNGPLILILSAASKLNWKKLIMVVATAGMVVWLLPLALFRSSLAVILVYHSNRGLQVESVPAQWSALINRFTQTESYVEVYKNYDITGPVSTGLKQIYDWLFPLALGIYVIYGFLMLLSVKTPEIKQKLLIGLSLGYVYTFMFFAKVLSTPFLLWQIPLIAVLPVKNWKQHLSWTIPATVMIIISMTKIPNWELGLINIHLLIGLTRVFLIAFLLIRTIGWVHETISDRPRIQRS